MCQIGVGRAYNDVCILATPLGRIESLMWNWSTGTFILAQMRSALTLQAASGWAKMDSSYISPALRASPYLERTTLLGQGGLRMFWELEVLFNEVDNAL